MIVNSYPISANIFWRATDDDPKITCPTNKLCIYTYISLMDQLKRLVVYIEVAFWVI